MRDRTPLPRATVAHDLNDPLPGLVDVVVSGFAVHHLAHERERQLFGEIAALLVGRAPRAG